MPKTWKSIFNSWENAFFRKMFNANVSGFYFDYAMLTLTMTLNTTSKIKSGQVKFIFKWKLPFFMTDLKRAKNTMSDMTLTLTLTLNLTAKVFSTILLLKIWVNFQKNVIDLHLTFEVIPKVKCKVIMIIGGHVKVENFFWKCINSQGQGHGQVHVERIIFCYFRIRHKSWGFPFKKSNSTWFDLTGHIQGFGQGYNWETRENPKTFNILQNNPFFASYSRIYIFWDILFNIVR